MVLRDHDIEAAILGSLLLNEEAIYLVADKLTVDHFDDAPNRYCYAACLEVAHAGATVSATSVAHLLSEQGILHLMGGWTYLDGLIARASALYQIDRYAKDLATISLRRRLVQAADRIKAISTDDSYDLEALRRNAAMAFFGVVENVPPPGSPYISTRLKDFMTVPPAQSQTVFGPDVTTGYLALDFLFERQGSCNLMVIAGRQGTGTTTLGLNVATNLAKQGIAGGILSLELDRRQIWRRLLSAESDVGVSELPLEDPLAHRAAGGSKAADAVFGLPLYIVDDPGLTMADIEVKTLRLKMQQRIRFLVIDSFNAISPSSCDCPGKPRFSDGVETPRALLALARDFDIPIIVCLRSRPEDTLSDSNNPPWDDQFDDYLINSDGPQLHDLSDTYLIGAADAVIILSRENLSSTKYTSKATESNGLLSGEFVEVRVAKNRNGPVTSVRLRCRAPIMRFDEVDDVTAVE